MNTGTELCVEREKTIKWQLSRTEKKKYTKALSVCLLELRKAAGITQASISDIIGVKRQTYGPIERGQQEMSWNTYMALLFYFYYNPYTHDIIRKKELFPWIFDGITVYSTETYAE